MNSNLTGCSICLSVEFDSHRCGQLEISGSCFPFIIVGLQKTTTTTKKKHDDFHPRPSLPQLLPAHLSPSSPGSIPPTFSPFSRNRGFAVQICSVHWLPDPGPVTSLFDPQVLQVIWRHYYETAARIFGKDHTQLQRGFIEVADSICVVAFSANSLAYMRWCCVLSFLFQPKCIL